MIGQLTVVSWKLAHEEIEPARTTFWWRTEQANRVLLESRPTRKRGNLDRHVSGSLACWN